MSTKVPADRETRLHFVIIINCLYVLWDSVLYSVWQEVPTKIDTSTVEHASNLILHHRRGHDFSHALVTEVRCLPEVKAVSRYLHRTAIALRCRDECARRIDHAICIRLGPGRVVGLQQHEHDPGNGFQRDERMRRERGPAFGIDQVGLDYSRADGVDPDAVVMPETGGDGAHEADHAVFFFFFSVISTKYM